MPWYFWVLLAVVVIETLVVVYFWLKSKPSQATITEDVTALLERRYTLFTKEQDNILNQKLYNQSVNFQLKVEELTKQYSDKVDEVKQEQKQLYQRMVDDPKTINNWLDEQLNK